MARCGRSPASKALENSKQPADLKGQRDLPLEPRAYMSQRISLWEPSHRRSYQYPKRTKLHSPNHNKVHSSPSFCFCYFRIPMDAGIILGALSATTSAQTWPDGQWPLRFRPSQSPPQSMGCDEPRGRRKAVLKPDEGCSKAGAQGCSKAGAQGCSKVRLVSLEGRLARDFIT